MNQYDKYVGKLIDGKYKIVKKVGEGGMAVVFEGIDITTDEKVAIKLLKESIADASVSVKRFINESKAIAMMNHPNIVRILDVSVKDSIKYIVMEYVDGISLKSYLNKKKVLSVPEAINYSEQILKALEHAHDKGIIHRDIKPQNVLLLKNGQIKVTDFGIAKLPNNETISMNDKAIGTVYYISPEQASGQQVDQRSDIYSLGVMMYEMLTGKLPFNASNPLSVAMKQINESPTQLRDINPNIPKGLEQIVMLAMEKRPARRFQSAKQMLAYLTQIKNNPNFVFKLKNSASDSEKTKKSKVSSQPTVDNIKIPEPRKEAAPAPQPKKVTQPQKRKKVHYSMFPIILGITLAFLLVAGLVAGYAYDKFFNIDHSEEKVTVTVPEVQGQIYTDDLKQSLEAKGFKITISYDEENIEAEANTILSQSPQSGTERSIILGKTTTDMKLKLSRGKDSIVLSDYTVQEYRAIELTLEEIGLRYKEEYEYNDNIPLGHIIKTSPMAGEIISKGGEVTLYISKGEEITHTEIPQLIGLTEEQAKKQLEEKGITLGSVTHEISDKEKGTVISQSRDAYESVVANTVTIDIIVSDGPDENALETTVDTTED